MSRGPADDRQSDERDDGLTSDQAEMYARAHRRLEKQLAAARDVMASSDDAMSRREYFDSLNALGAFVKLIDTIDRLNDELVVLRAIVARIYGLGDLPN